MTEARKKLTIPDLAAKKAAGERLVMVAVGEALTAAWAERAGVDIVGVGDSLGMTLHGHENTLAMTVDQMIEHTKSCCERMLPGSRVVYGDTDSVFWELWPDRTLQSHPRLVHEAFDYCERAAAQLSEREPRLGPRGQVDQVVGPSAPGVQHDGTGPRSRR